MQTFSKLKKKTTNLAVIFLCSLLLIIIFVLPLLAELPLQWVHNCKCIGFVWTDLEDYRAGFCKKLLENSLTLDRANASQDRPWETGTIHVSRHFWVHVFGERGRWALLWCVYALLHSHWPSSGNAPQPASGAPNLTPNWEWSWAQEEWKGGAKELLRFSLDFSSKCDLIFNTESSALPMTVTGGWSHPILIFNHKHFMIFCLLCSADEGHDRMALVGTRHSDKVSPLQCITEIEILVMEECKTRYSPFLWVFCHL